MHEAGGPEEFTGTSRFRVLRRLGAGAMGVVYEAWDAERGAAVALKTLHALDAADLYRLKKEFRALADVAHPNLVGLHELFCERERWFFTMELVPGTDFLEHVRPGWQPSDGDDSTVRPGPGERHAPVDPAAQSSHGALDVPRLRGALAQLASGIAALHAAGQLHRDLKPSNIRVRPDGRVLVLDFGLARSLGPTHRDESTEIVGTPAYMAPEQGAMEAIGPQADWYALGAVLYESLTGRPPFSGSALQVLMDKQVRLPAPPRTLASDVPDDLNALCMALLERRPQERPAAAEVLARTGAGGPLRSVSAASAQPVPVVGQQAVLAQLRAAFDEVRQGKAATVLLHGHGGVGTTTLARHFAESAWREANAVVLVGRCDERESVPFKALDGVVDALSGFLVRLPREQVDALLPRDVGVLARMFPVLKRVGAVSNARVSEVDIPDAQESRRRAALALRELLARIADRRPLVVVLDGLQWSDPDSAAIAAEVLRQPQAPAMLLVGCYRESAGAGEPESTPAVSELSARLASLSPTRDIDVQPLTLEESRELSGLLLGRAGLGDTYVDVLARESGGSPFFIHEMVHALQSLEDMPSTFTLSQALAARVARLPADARALLEVVASSGGPLRPDIAVSAARLEGDPHATLSLLRAAHLVRTSADGTRVEIYHDRIRQTLAAASSAEARRAVHAQLAAALEYSRLPQEAAVLAFHLEAAGQPERAAEWAARAAADAAQALAFERAARLYRLALSLRPPDGRWGRALESALGDALVDAGHGAEAAQVYLAASQRPWATESERRELERRAAEQYLRSGHVDRGVDVLRGVLEAYGLRLPKTPGRALASLALRQAVLMIRGTGFRLRDATQLSAVELARIDACWSGAVGLGMVDVIQGAAIQARHLQLALAAGEPMRVARALAAQAPFVSTPGGARAERAAQDLISRAREVARELSDPKLTGLVGLVTAMVDFLGGRWRSCHENAEVAARLLEEKCTGVAWEVTNCHLYSLWALYYLGDLAELGHRVDALLREAQARGDLFAAASLRTGIMSVPYLVRDDVAGARREVADVLAQWSQRGFHFQHYWALLAQGIIDLYAGDGAQAHERMESTWPTLERSLLLRIQNVRVEATYLRARCALAAAARPDGSRDARLLTAVERDARVLEKTGAGWGRAHAELIRAGLAMARGERDVAVRRFEGAARLLDGVDQSLYAAAARRRVGELRGGDEGAALASAADERMRSKGIASPAKMAMLLSP